MGVKMDELVREGKMWRAEIFEILVMSFMDATMANSFQFILILRAEPMT